MYPNIINFYEVDFSECRSKEVVCLVVCLFVCVFIYLFISVN